jgi:dolichyl-phosphate-mannose--protein O-mannosyl transferase
MSVLKPKDGDYVTRGIFLLLAWFCFGWLPFAFLGAVTFSLLFGPTSAVAGATIFFALSIPLGLFLHWLYLGWRTKEF